jgi:TRAP-type C4-dicarboxylate transport system substrate-binding protein
MKKRSLLQGFVFAMTLAAGLVAGPAVYAQAPVKLTYATYLTNGALAVKLDIWFMNEVTKRSNGRITFETYFAGAMLEAPDVFPGLEHGAVDIATGAPGPYNAKDYPLSSVVLPYITDHADTATTAVTELLKTNAGLRQEYLKHGIVPLWALAFPESTVWTNKKVQTVADLKGMRIRAASTVADALSFLGATAVPLTWSEGVEALRRGAVDGMASAPFDSAVNNGLQEVAAFMNDAGRMGIYSITSSGINKARFDALDPEARKIILQVAAEVPARYLADVNDVIQAAAEKLAKSKSITVVSISGAEADAWRAEAAPKVQEKWLKSVAAADPTLDARAVLDAYIALVRQYEPQSKYVPGIDRYLALKGSAR